jgi:hypothetical protein
LFQASQSQDPAQRENAFRIFSTTPQIIEKQHEDVVMTAFKGGFADTESSVGRLDWTYSTITNQTDINRSESLL